MTTILGSTINSFSGLDAAIVQADAETVAGTYEIELASNATIDITADLDAINLAAGVTLDIVGNDATLYGGGTQRGLFVYAGDVSIASLSLDDLLAQGGNGGSGYYGGGGGAGLGGGLFVAAAGDVTLDQVSFGSDGGVIGRSLGLGGSSGGGGGSSGGGASGGGGGLGGFGAGHGSDNGGGGGLGAGGDIFVQQGGSLTIASGTFNIGGATGGTGADGAGNGYGLGSGMFLQGNEVVTLAPAAGQTVTISGEIADQGGSVDGGAGTLDIDGAGTVVLSAVNTFVGGAALISGTLSLQNAEAAGTGSITFAGGGTATLLIDHGDVPANVIDGFAPGDTIDLQGIGLATGATVGGNKLILSGGTTPVTLDLPLPSGVVPVLTNDNAGGTDITVPPISFTVGSEAALNAAIEAADALTTPYTYQIVLASNATIAITAELEAINLAAGVTLDIIGNGATLYGAGSQRGLFVYAGAVTIESLALDDLRALGGNGGSGALGGDPAGRRAARPRPTPPAPDRPSLSPPLPTPAPGRQWPVSPTPTPPEMLPVARSPPTPIPR